MLKNKKGITLIALVVTIVVLLILAGVTISLLLDENGIIAKSKDARTETKVSQIEDEVGMWKQHNFINKESNQAQESADTMLANLISRKLLTEEEIDRDQELITIKKKDGTIIKEISYSSVTINISKSPATKKAGAVILTVDSVEGMTRPNIDMTNGDEELNNFVNSLSEDQKKEIIRNGYIKLVNKEDPSANCTTFQDVLDLAKEQGEISEATEDAFWTGLLSEQGLDENLIAMLKEVYFNKFTKMIEGYTVTNPNNKKSNTYIATANGTYTFKIQDIVTGKTYTKKVEVTNVDTSLPAYVPVTSISRGWTYIHMFDESINNYTTFEKAYVILNGEKIELKSNDLKKAQDNKYESVYTVIPNTLSQLVEEGKLTERPNLFGTTQTFILVKDGVEYEIQVVITEGIAS
ncbi:MAG: type II secretion system protein [Clostridia bacterium]